MTPGLFTCPRRIGFLFPHACSRLTPIGCPDCQNGQVDDPYQSRTDRESYGDYDDYGDDGFDASPSGASMDFTEADGEDLVRPDEEFEDDLTES